MTPPAKPETESELLLKKYCPALYPLMKKSKINWKDIDQHLNDSKFSTGVVHSDFFLFCKEADKGSVFAKDFLYFLNELVDETERLVKEKKKFREMFIGKLNNVDGWNYLNPIGELAFLKKLLVAGYELIHIEDKSIYPQLTPKDFLVKSPENKEFLIEVVNIHVDDEDYASLFNLKRRLNTAVLDKINKETNRLSIHFPILFFQPIIWIYDFEKGQAYEQYFQNFTKTFGKEVHPIHKTMGYCAIGRVMGKFWFGEVSSFYKLG